MSEESLPFPVHGTRTTGTPEDASHRAQGTADAARALYFANLLAGLTGAPVLHLHYKGIYGSASAAATGPLRHKTTRYVTEEERDPPRSASIARLVWLPEGFVITPRTPAAPKGYGMPPTTDKRGTPGGPLSQVMLNRFADNQYPDAVYRVAGGAERGVVHAANLFYMDWENQPGEMRIGVTLVPGIESSFVPQFKARYVTNYKEPDGKKWFCHRPQNTLVETEAEALIRTETNLLREAVGRAPLAPPLRGTAGELSQNVAYQIRWSGKYDHNRPEFREGHRTFEHRAEARTGFGGATGENLNLEFPASLSKATVLSFMGSWRTSSGHYASMVADWHEEESAHAWIDPAFTGAGKAATPDGTEGALGVQIFYGASEWVKTGDGVHAGRAPVTTDAPRAMYRPVYQQRSNPASGDMFWPFVMYRGRTVFITATNVHVNSMEVLSGTTTLEERTDTNPTTNEKTKVTFERKLRVAVLLRPTLNAGQVFLVVYEGEVHDFLATRTELVRHTLPLGDADQISIPVWSESGARMAFGLTTLAPVPKGRIQDLVHSPEFTTFVGQQVHFRELVGTTVMDRGTDQLLVDATDFSSSHQHSSCVGTVRLLPTYTKEVLKFVYVEVDSDVYFSPRLFTKRVYGALLFPDGKRLVYADQSCVDDQDGVRGPVRGFVRHILPFDASDSESAAYIQYDHPALPTDRGISARLVIRGTEIKYSPSAYGAEASGAHYRVPYGFDAGYEYTLDSFRGNPYWDPFFSPGMSFFGGIGNKYTPSGVFRGVVVGDSNICPPSRLVIGPPGTYRGPATTSPRDTSYILLGPTLLQDGSPRYERLYEDSPSTEELFDRVERFSYCRYKDQWIYAGRIENTLGGTGTFTSGFSPGSHTRSAWLGDDQYYFHSSLDLSALTGMPDLSQNILPIGVL